MPSLCLGQGVEPSSWGEYLFRVLVPVLCFSWAPAGKGQRQKARERAAPTALFFPMPLLVN